MSVYTAVCLCFIQPRGCYNSINVMFFTLMLTLNQYHSCNTVEPPTGGSTGGYLSAIKSIFSWVSESVEDIVSAVTIKRSTQSLGDGLWRDVDIKVNVWTVVPVVYTTDDLVSRRHLNLRNTQHRFHFSETCHLQFCSYTRHMWQSNNSNFGI